MPSPKLTNTIVDDNNNNNPADGGNNTSTAERLSDLLPPKQRSPRDNKISALRTSISTLETQVAETATQLATVQANLRSPEDASKTVQQHIRLLHEYNEIRDIGQGLLGLIADARGVRHVDVQREFGVADGD